ncbi:MAG: transposase [Rhizobiales bacterium]|nr:transposase [Hyphomicrobiales bacterium]
MVERKKEAQFSFADALLTARVDSDHLGKLSWMVKRYRFEKVLEPLACKSETRRPAYTPVNAVQGTALATALRLSELELAGALYDRLSYRRFCGFGLEKAVPITRRCVAFATGWWTGRVDEAVLRTRTAALCGRVDPCGTARCLDAARIETAAAAHPPRAAG